jgi:C4-dicarboxylate-specific signal transduction histidine kinase
VVSSLQLAGEVFANAIVRRQAKQRLEQNQRELAHLARAAALGELASVIAHELDQPLTAVVTNAEAVRHLLKASAPDRAEADDALCEIVHSAMTISGIIKREHRLLRKSDQGLEPTDLNDAVREVELFIRADARQRRAHVSFELSPGLPTVQADRVQLQQVVLNLARNGLQAMGDTPGARHELVIHTATETGEVTLSVKDCGPPVDGSVLERMFEPFYTTKANGLGMGLSISRSIIARHHGRIWATRNRGGGLTVNVSIPRK